MQRHRQILAHARSVSGNASRAGALIAAAGITPSFTAKDNAPISLAVLVGVFGLTAVARGLVALWPRRGSEHDVEGMLDDVWNVSIAEVVIS